MRVVELCFHERDGRAAEMAARGLAEAGLCVLRRPVSGGRVPAPSPAARQRVILHSEAFASLIDSRDGIDEGQLEATVAVPLERRWPRRASRAWLIAPPRAARLQAGAFWKTVAWATTQAIGTRDRRIAAQLALFRRLATLGPEAAPLTGRKRNWRDLVELGVRPARGSVAAPVAVAATLLVAAFVSALVVDIASRPEAWSAIAQAPGKAVSE
jgi:hypothetical protein